MAEGPFNRDQSLEIRICRRPDLSINSCGKSVGIEADPVARDGEGVRISPVGLSHGQPATCIESATLSVRAGLAQARLVRRLTALATDEPKLWLRSRQARGPALYRELPIR